MAGNSEGLSHASISEVGAFSIEFLLKPSALVGLSQIIGASNNWGSFNHHTNFDVGRIYCGISETYRFDPTSGGEVYSVGTATYTTYTLSAGWLATLYKNGAYVNSETHEQPSAWGGLVVNPTGLLSELRISTVDRSAAWIKATNLTLRNTLFV
jgi:hypothetical protein